MDLPDNYFRDRSPADIIAKVATITLANISLLGSSELRRIGWLDNPIIDILYSMTSAGVWISRVDTSGRLTDANSGAIKTDLDTANTYQAQLLASVLTPTVTGSGIATVAGSGAAHRRIAQVPLTEAAGAIAATAIVTGIASYKARCIIKKIWAPAGTTDAANTWTIASEAGGNLTGPSTFTMNLTAERNHWVDAGAAGVAGSGILAYADTADKDITLAAADLANIGITYYVEVEYWYEA